MSIPLPAWAQQAQKVYRIGVLGVASPSLYASQVDAFRKGLSNLGYVEGRNIRLEIRWANGNMSRLPQLATELVQLAPDVIVTSGPGTAIAKRATSTIPIVMAVSANAVENGLVASFAHPGGNVTGSSSFSSELGTKQLELLKETFPRIARVGLLLYAGSPTDSLLVKALEEAARIKRVQLQHVKVGGPSDFEATFASHSYGTHGICRRSAPDCTAGTKQPSARDRFR
jgi:putative ABC transport system substrate-binding protein